MDLRVNRLIQLLGLLFFSFFLVLAVVYFKERMLNFDPAFFSFYMLQNHGFSIAFNRWGMFFTELLPYTGMQLGCSLQTFLILFSISPVINYYIVFLVITAGLKQYKIGLAMLLGLCLMFRLTFYYTTAELYQGMALSFLLWALLHDQRYISKKRMIISLLLVVTISYYHQLTAFTVVFVLLFEYLLRSGQERRRLAVLLGVTVLWYLIRIALLTGSDYERDKIPGLSEFFTQLPHLLQLPSTVHFVEFARYQAWPWALLFLLAVIFAVMQKRYLLTALTLAFAGGFTVLILITYWKGESVMGYENYYTVLGFFPALLFLQVSWQRWKPLVLLAVVVPLLAKCLLSIQGSHYILTERLDYLARLIKEGRKMPEKRYLVHPSCVNTNVVDGTWALSFETLLYSSLEHPDSAVSIYYCLDGYEKYELLLSDPNLLLGPGTATNWFSMAALRTDRFHLPLGTVYRKLNTEPEDSLPLPSEIELIPVKDTVYSNVLTHVTIPVNIINHSKQILHSIPVTSSQCTLTYRMYDKEGVSYFTDFLETPLEADVRDHYLQGVMVYHGLKKGEYLIEIRLIGERLGVASKKRVRLIVK